MKIPGIYQDESIRKFMFLIIAAYVGMRANSYVNQLWNPALKKYTDKKKSKSVPSKHIEKVLILMITNNVYLRIKLLVLEEKRIEN